MFASINAGDVTAFAAVGSILLVIGGYIQHKSSKAFENRKKQRTNSDRTVTAVWGQRASGTPGTPDYIEDKEGLLDVVADLAKQVKQQGLDYTESTRELREVQNGVVKRLGVVEQKVGISL